MVLKPCPFCNGESRAVQIITAKKGFHDWEVLCNDCSACLQFFDSKEDAEVAWNRRGGTAGWFDIGKEKEKQACPNCGHYGCDLNCPGI